jgi:hypothetical protein
MSLAPGQRKILRDRSIKLMQKRIPPGSSTLGWWGFDGRASGVLSHGGNMDGVSTIVFLVPANRLVVVGLCSTAIDLPRRAAAEIVNRMSLGVVVDIDRQRLPPLQSGHMPASLAGEWTGDVLAHNGSHPFTLSMGTNGELWTRLGDQPRESVQMVEWVDGELRGVIASDLGTLDVRQPYRLRFELHQLNSDQLEGPISAWSFRLGRASDILPSFLRVHRVTHSDR